jgi:5'-phosphate synthase pdxT subunit
MPAFGTCAGMILLASEVLDGRPDNVPLGAIDLSVRRNGFGRQRESFEAELEVADLAGGPLPAVFIRAPVVTRTGPDVDVLAEVDDGPVLCRAGAVTVASFHPELGDDRRLHERFVREL